MGFKEHSQQESGLLQTADVTLEPGINCGDPLDESWPFRVNNDRFPTAPLWSIDLALDSEVYRNLKELESASLGVVCSLQHLIAILPSTPTYMNDAFTGGEFQDDATMEQNGQLMTADLEDLKWGLYQWIDEHFVSAYTFPRLYTRRSKARQILGIANVSSFDAASFQRGFGVHVDLASITLTLLLPIRNLVDVFKKHWTKDGVWTSDTVPIDELMQAIDGCHRVIAEKRLTEIGFQQMEGKIQIEHYRATAFLIQHRWLTDKKFDPPTGQGTTSDPDDDLFEAKEIGTAVYLAARTIYKLMAGWKPAKCDSRGRRARRFSYKENLEILRSQFCEYEFPDTLTELRIQGRLAKKRLA